MAELFINSSFMNDEKCGSTENNRNWQVSIILETTPTHATEYN